MKAFLPIEITDARLTSTSLPEVPPAAYNAGTTYALDAQVSTDEGAGVRYVYKSLQNSNTGHTPASSTDWWEYLGATYQEYSGGATYAEGDRVIDATTHKVYESATAGNIGHALTDTEYWLYAGPTNARAPFDYMHSLGAVGPSGLTFTITPGQRVNCFQFDGLRATSVHP
jgi:hypothetical protein